MKQLLNLALLVSFQFCYLEWPNNKMFIFQIESEIVRNYTKINETILHPIVFLCLITQLILIVSVIFENFSSKTNIISVVLLNILVLFFIFIGIISKNSLMLFYNIPFVILSILFFKFINKKTASFPKQF